MKKFLGIVSCLVLILVAGVTFAACGPSSSGITISSSETELEIVLGSEEETKTVEFIVEGFGNGSGQLDFDVEEQEKNTISCTPEYQGNGRTTLTITGKNRGTATITATSIQGSVKHVITVKVVQPITGLAQVDEFKDKLYAISGSSLNLSQEKIWNYSPSETNQRDLVFSFIGESQGCRIEDGKLIVDQDCGLSSVTIRAESAFNSSVYCEIPVAILNPIEVVAQASGKTIVETITDPNSQVSNFFEIFPRETEYQNSLTITLIIKAGNEKQALNVEAVFSSGEEKFAAPQTGYYFDRASQTHRYTFLIQANSQDAGKIDSLTFRASYSGYAAGESEYNSNSININLSSYNKALQVDVNGQAGQVEVDVFENSINLVDGEILEISLLPGNLKLDQNYIILWAEDFENLPISLYKLDSTRRNYICVFGYDQNGNPVGSTGNGIRYAKIQSGTKLYAFINNNYQGLTGTNKQSTIYAQAVEFWNSEITSNERAFTTIDFVINPNAKDIFLAQPNDQGVLEADKDNKTIFIELGETEIAYIAVDPSTFTIGANSVVTIANESLAEIGELVEHAVSEDFVFAKFEIVANKVGSTTLTVTLSDGKQVDFNLVVISPLEELEMGLESVVIGETEIGSDIVPYRHLPDTTVIVGETTPFIALNKLSISNNGGAGIRLTKNATPQTAQYYLSYNYYDYTFESGKDIKNITLEDIDIENINFNTTSSIINTSLLANQTIVEAVNSSTEGAVLVRISVYAMGADGEYSDQPVGYFYYLIDFFIPTSGLTLSSGTLELYTYDTIGDKFLLDNVSRSIGEFSVTVNPVNQGLTPTYINNLKIYVNGNSVNIMERFTNDVLYLYFDGSIAYSRNNAALEIIRSFENNTFTFKFQALRREANYIFAMVLSEVDESKTFTALGRIIAKEAVEISDIEIINANQESPIYIENVFLAQEDFESEEAYLEYINDIIDNPYQLELVYNLYSKNGNEITNPSLEFEVEYNLISGEREYYTDINGNKINFVQIIQENGKTSVKIIRAAWDYSSYYELSEEERAETTLDKHKVLVEFGASATISVYPTSNYYNAYNGWNGEEPIVSIPITVADGKTSQTSLQLWDLEDLELLRLHPAANFTIMANISMVSESNNKVPEEFYENYAPVEEFYGTLRGDPDFAGGGTMPLIISVAPLFKKIANGAVVENFSYVALEVYDDDSVFDSTKFASTVNGETYLDAASMFSGARVFVDGEKAPAGQAIILFVGINTDYENTGAALIELLEFTEVQAGELVRYTGFLVGLNRGTIEITDTSTVSGIGAAILFGANVGGIVGVNDTTGKIVGYNFYGNVIGTETAGGIAALNKGEIKNCNILNGGTHLYGINVFVLGEDVYSYAEEKGIDIQFAAGGIAAISKGGKIQGCSTEIGTGTNPPDSSMGEGGAFEKVFEPELGSTVWGKRIAKAGTYYVNQKAEYDFNILENGTVLTGTIKFLRGGSNENIEDILVELPKLTEENPSHYFVANGREYRIYAQFGTSSYINVTIYDVTEGEETSLKSFSIYKYNSTHSGEFETLDVNKIVVSSDPIYCGGLVGILSETKLSQSFFDGTLGVRDSNSGGLVGYLYESAAEEPLVDNCYAVLGYANSYVERAKNAGYILRQGLFISGGSLNEIKYCYVSSNNTTFGPSYNGEGRATGSFHSAIGLTSIIDIINYNGDFLGFDITEWADKTFTDLEGQYTYIDGTMSVTPENTILTASSQIVGDTYYGRFEMSYSLTNPNYGAGSLSFTIHKNGTEVAKKTIEIKDFALANGSSVDYTFADLGIKVSLTPVDLNAATSRGIMFVATDVSSGETLYEQKVTGWESSGTINGVEYERYEVSSSFGFKTVETTVSHNGQNQVISRNLYSYPNSSSSYELYRFTHNGKTHVVELSSNGAQSFEIKIKYQQYESSSYWPELIREWVDGSSETKAEIEFAESYSIVANLNLRPGASNEQLNQKYEFNLTFDGQNYVSKEQYEFPKIFGRGETYLVVEGSPYSGIGLMIRDYYGSGYSSSYLCTSNFGGGETAISYDESSKIYLELAKKGEILYSKISQDGLTATFGSISLLYMKAFYQFLYDNYDVLIADETWDGISYAGASGITGAEVKEVICQLFGISPDTADIKAAMKKIIDEKVIKPFNNSLAELKTDIGALQGELEKIVSEIETLLKASGYEYSEYSDLLEKLNSYSTLIAQAQTTISGIESITSGSDIKNLILNAIEPVRKVIGGVYYQFIMFVELNGEKLNDYMEENFKDEEEVLEAMGSLYSLIISVSAGEDRYEIIDADGLTSELFIGLVGLYAFDPENGYGTIPEKIDGFIEAGWDIANKGEESDSIWVFDEGWLPHFRQNEESQRIHEFDVEINPNKNQDSMINKDNSSVVLFYYDVADKSLLTTTQLSQLAMKNMITIDEFVRIFNINGNLNTTGSFEQFIFQSSDRSVVRVINGQLQIIGTGSATITIMPLRGPALGSVPTYSINVYVIYPFGETNIYNGISAETGTNSSNNPINVEEGEESEPITIIKGDVNYITIKTDRYIALENTIFNFLTNLISIDVSITHQTENGTEVDYDSNGTDNKFNISGLTGQDGKFIEGTLGITIAEDVSEEQIFTFFANILLQSGSQPFPNASSYFIDRVNNILSGLFNEYFNFKVSVRAEKLLLSIKEAEIDPSTIISVDTELHTNRDEDRIKIMIKDESGNVVWASESVVEDLDGNIRFVTEEDYENDKLNAGLAYVFEKGETSSIFEVNGADLWENKGSNLNGNKTIVNGVLNGNILIGVKEDARKLIDTTKNYTVILTDSKENISNSFNFTLKPQKIINVTYTHHNRTDDSTASGIKIQDEPSSVLVPGDNGLLTIGLYPTYGSYSRIVLESQIIDNNYYVLMEQMYKSGEYYLSTSTTVGYSSVRDVNKLTIYKPTDTNLNTGYIYVRTRILENVNQGLYFPITITIYDKDENGEEYVVKTETITLVSQVIDGAQITIDGEKGATVVRGYTYPIQISVEENQTLADYNLVDFDSTGDPDDSIAVYFNRAEYEIVDGRKVYNGTISIGLDAELAGDGVFKVETIVQKIINGRIESTTDNIELRIVDFLIDDVQIKGNAEGDNVFNTPAAIEKDMSFEFILTETPEIFSSSQQDSINRINNAKEEFLNSLAYKQYVTTNDKIYQYIVNTDRIFGVNSKYNTDKNQPSHISTSQMSIIYDLYYAGDLTALVNGATVQQNEYFSFAYDGDSNGTTGLGAKTIRVVGKRMGAINLTLRIGYQLPGLAEVEYFNYNFTINVQMYSDEDKPTPIESEEQFIEYLTSTTEQYGETNFILMKDLVLENFVPFPSTNFASLDGNNKVITIKNFDLSSQTTGGLNIGLFQTVSKGSTLKNLVVNYNETEGIFVDESLYSSVNFGGIAVTNDGIIYNCEVVSVDMSQNNMATDDGGIEIYFNQTNKDAQKLDRTTVQIAGLVVTNSATGSITNSRVGGKGSFKKVVYIDGVGASETNYNYSKINIIGQGNMSGFVISNSGTISASYFANGFITNKTISGALCATAGFVITNNLSSTITGCYAEGFRTTEDGLEQFMTGGGITSQGVSAGFIYENAGTISDCYSNIKLAGDSTGRLVSGFVYSNETTGTIARCYSASTIVGELTTQMPFTGKDARENSLQNNPEGIINSYYLVKRYDSETVLEEKYKTGATALTAATLTSSTLYGFAMAWEDDENSGIWRWNETYKYPELVSANQIAISVRRIIENYSSLITGGTSTESLDIFPYIQGYEYGSALNPIIIRTADEFNRVFGQETNLVENAYYAISQMYDKDLGIVFGSYRLVSSVDFDELTTVENIKISSSIMNLAQNNAYFGTFEGNGLVIRNVEIALDSQSSVGLFSMITSGGVFKNATITVITVAGGQRSVYAGAVAGLVQNSAISNVTVQPVTTSGDNRSRISGQNIVGGVVGAVIGNSKVSNLVSNMSVVSGNANGSPEIEEYYESHLRGGSTIENGVVVDQNSKYSFAGGVIGVLDIYQNIYDEIVSFSDPNAIRLQYSGQNISIQGSFVGGVVGFVGPSTYLADASFVLTGQQDQLNQRLISYGNTIGGVVGVNYGELYELKIEHATKLQLEIEDNMEDYYNNTSTTIFRGNTKLFNSTTSELKTIGGLVGQMMSGELTVSYSKVDVSASASEHSGGAIGINNVSTDFYEIYSFGDVTGKKAGGLIGLNNAEITLDKCVAFTYYSKENAALNEIIGVAQDFNSGNLTFAGANIPTGESYSGRLQFVTGSGKTILIGFYHQSQAQESNATYITINIDTTTDTTTGTTTNTTNIIKQWDINGYNFYTYDNGSKEYGLIKERIYNSDFMYGYYYTINNKETTVLWETEDGLFYFDNNKAPTIEEDTPSIEFAGSVGYVSFESLNYIDPGITEESEKEKYDRVDDLTSTGANKVVSYASFGMTQAQITKIQLNQLTIGAIFGENGEEGNVIITNANQESVYGNLMFNYNGFEINLWNNGLIVEGELNNLLGLTVNISNYQGYEIDGQTINKMFFGSGWRPNLWELRDGFVFPTFNYEISTNVLYIEKPLDLLKLKEYNKSDNVVIFGDDPGTVFNPYEYESGNISTYGEFTAAELVGLTATEGDDGKGKYLIYDVSVIQSSLPVNYSDYYFSTFKGTMYGEEKDGVSTPVLKNVDKALFNMVYGGEISNLAFDNGEKDGNILKTASGALLANIMEGQTKLENLAFRNIEIKSQREQIGVISNYMTDVFEISGIKISNVDIIKAQSAAGSNIFIGGIAGENVSSTKLEQGGTRKITLEGVSIADLEITVEGSVKANSVRAGGLFGRVGYSTNYEKTVSVSGIEINVGLGKEDEESFDAENIIYAGGFIGDSSGLQATFMEGSTQTATGIAITLGDAAVSYAGGIFGTILTIQDNADEQFIISDVNIKSDEEQSVYSAVIVGGFAGQVSTSRNLTSVEIDFGETGGDETANVDLNTNVFGTTSSIISSVGGVFGKATNGTLSGVSVSNVDMNLTNQITTPAESEDEDTSTQTTSEEGEEPITIFGGLVGEATNASSEDKAFTISGGSFTGDITIDENAGIFYGGGIVGRAPKTLNITGSTSTANMTFENTATDSTYYVGGILGTGTTDGDDVSEIIYTISNSTFNGSLTFAGSNSSLDGAEIITGGIAGANIKGGSLTNNTFSETGTISFDSNSATEADITVGGIAGGTIGTTVGTSDTTAPNNKSYGNITFSGQSLPSAEIVEGEIVAGGIVAGGIVGSMNGGEASNNYVGGNIIVGKTGTDANGDPIQSSLNDLALTAGGVVGSIDNGGTVSGNYTWGNIELSKNAELFNNENDYAIAELNVGGVVGSVSGTLTFTGNNSLTSIYIVQRAQTHNINAMIGNKGYTVTGSSFSGNFYSHQITLATESTDIAENCYYKTGSITTSDGGDGSPMLTKFNGVKNNLSADQKEEGTKLNPKPWTGDEEINKNAYYYINKNAYPSSLDVDGHLVGDGYYISPNSTITAFGDVNGYVSGILFIVATTCVGGADGGRVSGTETDVINGVAQNNNGIIFNVTVTVGGSGGNELVNGNVRYSILSGIANTNNGLISDSGVILNVKDAYAGISGSNSGVIANSYVTGAVHEGAEFAFAGGTDGAVINSYAAIKVQSGGSVVEGKKKENFFYDRFATETASVADSEEDKTTYQDKTTDDMSTVDETTTDILENDSDDKKLLGDNWLQSTGYNFGYPYLGGGAYNGFSKLGNSLIAAYGIPNSSSYIPNPGKLEQAMANNLSFELLADMDINSSLAEWTSPDSFGGTLNGKNYQIHNIPNVSGGFVKTLTGIIQNVAIRYWGLVEGADVGGYNRAGGIAAVNEGAISNVSSTGIEVSATADAGGLVGYNIGTIMNSKNYNIRVRGSNAGGIAGFVGSNIDYNMYIWENSNYGGVEGVRAGGIVGEIGNQAYLQGTFSDNYNYGRVDGVSGEGDMVAGGIVGLISSEKVVQLSNGYNYGPVFGANIAGGIVGLMKNKGKIILCYNDGVISSEVVAGGIVGQLEVDSIKRDQFNSGSNEYIFQDGTRLTFEVERYRGPGGQQSGGTNEAWWRSYEWELFDTNGNLLDSGLEKCKEGSVVTEVIRYGWYQYITANYNCLTVIDLPKTSDIEYAFNRQTVSVKGDGDYIYAGGIVGRLLNGYVERAVNRGGVESRNTTNKVAFAGGIVGGTVPGAEDNRGVINNVMNYGAVGAENTSTGTKNGVYADELCNNVMNIGFYYSGGSCWENNAEGDHDKGGNNGGNGLLGDDVHAAEVMEENDILIAQEENLNRYGENNNWSSHVDEAKGETDYIYVEDSKTYYVYTALGFAYAVSQATETTVIEFMDDIDLSDYNWDFNTAIAPGGSAEMYVSRNGSNYTGVTVIGGLTYELHDAGGRGGYIDGPFGNSVSGGLFSMAAGVKIDKDLAFSYNITGSIRGSIGSDGTGTLTLKINGGRYYVSRKYTSNQNGYSRYGD